MTRSKAVDHAREYLKSKGLRAWKYSHFHRMQSGNYGIIAYITYHPGRTMDLMIFPTGKVVHA